MATDKKPCPTLDQEEVYVDTRGPQEVPEIKVAVVKDDHVEQDLFEINRVATLRTSTVTEETPDPFAADAKTVREYAGIEDMGFKRKITNQINKAYTGIDKASSSRIDEALEYNGYDIFGVVQAPYNLYAFTKLYELSAPHYAAVNANCNCIVTEDIDDYYFSEIEVLSTEDFMDAYVL